MFFQKEVDIENLSPNLQKKEKMNKESKMIMNKNQYIVNSPLLSSLDISSDKTPEKNNFLRQNENLNHIEIEKEKEENNEDIKVNDKNKEEISKNMENNEILSLKNISKKVYPALHFSYDCEVDNEINNIGNNKLLNNENKDIKDIDKEKLLEEINKFYKMNVGKKMKDENNKQLSDINDNDNMNNYQAFLNEKLNLMKIDLKDDDDIKIDEENHKENSLKGEQQITYEINGANITKNYSIEDCQSEKENLNPTEKILNNKNDFKNKIFYLKQENENNKEIKSEYSNNNIRDENILVPEKEERYRNNYLNSYGDENMTFEKKEKFEEKNVTNVKNITKEKNRKYIREPEEKIFENSNNAPTLNSRNYSKKIVSSKFSDSLSGNTVESMKRIDEEAKIRTMEIEKEEKKLNELEQKKIKLIEEEKEIKRKILEEIQNQERKEKERKKEKLKMKYKEQLKKKKEDEEKLKQLKQRQENELKIINELKYKKKLEEEKLILLREGKLDEQEINKYKIDYNKEVNDKKTNRNKLPFTIDKDLYNDYKKVNVKKDNDTVITNNFQNNMPMKNEIQYSNVENKYSNNLTNNFIINQKNNFNDKGIKLNECIKYPNINKGLTYDLKQEKSNVVYRDNKKLIGKNNNDKNSSKVETKKLCKLNKYYDISSKDNTKKKPKCENLNSYLKYKYMKLRKNNSNLYFERNSSKLKKDAKSRDEKMIHYDNLIKDLNHKIYNLKNPKKIKEIEETSSSNDDKIYHDNISEIEKDNKINKEKISNLIKYQGNIESFNKIEDEKSFNSLSQRIYNKKNYNYCGKNAFKNELSYYKEIYEQNNK